MKRNRSYIKNYLFQHWELYAMFIPAIAFFIVFSYTPMFGLQIAFKDWDPNKGIWNSPLAVNEAGNADIFKYFKVLFTDPEVFSKLVNTLRLSSLRMIFSFPVPILIVVFMNEMKIFRLKKAVQTIMYLPHFISWVIISGILISFSRTGGPLQEFLKSIFGKEIFFFSNSDLFIVVLIISSIWKESGWATIIYLAAISNIDPCLEEAAKIDGAGRMKRIENVILPGIVPAISINLIFSCSNLIHGGFDQVFNMYNTAVYSKGDILETYLYRIGINSGNYSLSTALGFFNSVVALTLMLVANYIVKKLGGSQIW